MRPLVLLVAGPAALVLLASLWAPDFTIRLEAVLLGSQLGLDPGNRPFLLVTGLAWLCAGLLAQTALSRQPLPTTGFATVFVANVAAVLSQDLVTFYAAFAVMSLSAYALIATPGAVGPARTARVYITLAVTGELILFAALVGLAGGGAFLLVDHPVVSAPGWVTLCVIIGFGIKAGLLPLHVTLPMVYRAVPLAAGVALAGAAVNVGVLGWLRWLPLGEPAPWAPPLLVTLGAAGYLYAVAVGLLQTAPRALLGYSSVSQMSLMVIALGATAASAASWAAGAALVAAMMSHHALAKTCLFVASGGIPRPPTLRALWWLGLSVAALALAGAPLTAGYLGKAGLEQALLTGGPAWLAGWLWLTGPATLLLMARFVWLMRERPGSAASTPLWPPRRRPVNGAYAVLAATAALAALLHTNATASLEQTLSIESAGAAAPLLAVLLAGWLWSRGRSPRPGRAPIPPGDLAEAALSAWQLAAAPLRGRSARLAVPRAERQGWAPVQRLRRRLPVIIGEPAPNWTVSATTIIAVAALLAGTLILAA